MSVAAAPEEEDDYSDLMDLFEDDEEAPASSDSSGLFDEDDEGPEQGESEDDDQGSQEEPGGDSAFKSDDNEEDAGDASGTPSDEDESEQDELSQSRDEDRRRTENIENLTERLAAIQEQNERRRQDEERQRQEKAQREAQERAQEERNQPLYNEDQLNLTDEERSAYKDALPVLNKVARSVAQDVHDRTVKPLQDEIDRLKGQTQNIGRTASQTRAEAFVSAIRGAVPDLDQRTKAPGWEDYMREQVSVPGQGKMTRAKAVQIATQSSDLSFVVDQVKGFQTDASAEQKPQGAQSPGKGQASSQSAKPAKTKPKTVAYSKSMSQLEEMSQKVRNGRMSLDKYEAAVDKFEQAMADGQVEMDA